MVLFANAAAPGYLFDGMAEHSAWVGIWHLRRAALVLGVVHLARDLGVGDRFLDDPASVSLEAFALTSVQGGITFGAGSDP